MTELDFFERMQRAMTDQAGDIWDMVHFSRSRGYRLRLGEVTATEYNFFRLREFWTKRVYLVTNEPDELATGADWEWLIGHGEHWVQIRVQAKILNRNGSFAELGHPDRTGQQIERLLNPDPNDVLCRWLPLYVFYAAEPVARTPVPRDSGCSAQLAARVRATYGKPPASRATLAGAAHLPGSIPWAGVFDGLVSRLRSGQSLSEIVESIAGRPLSPDITRIAEFWNVGAEDGTCNRPMPSYIREIVRRDDDDFDRSSMARLEVDTSERRHDEPGAANPASDLEDSAPDFEDPLQAFLLRHDADDSSALLPTRSVTLEPSGEDRTRSTLPSFVSVIDIDRLNDITDD